MNRTLERLADASGGRLAPLKPAPLGPLARLIAAYHLGDPLDASDSWRPLLRRRRLAGEARQAAIHARLPASDSEIDH